MTKCYDYSNMSLEEILSINEEENEIYDFEDSIQDDIVDSDKWTSLGGGCRTTAGKNYDE